MAYQKPRGKVGNEGTGKGRVAKKGGKEREGEGKLRTLSRR